MYLVDGRWLMHKAGRAPDPEELGRLVSGLDPAPVRTVWYDAKAAPAAGVEQVYLRRLASTPGVRVRLGEMVVREPSEGMLHSFRRALEGAAGAVGVDAERLAVELARRWEFKPATSQKMVDTLLVMDLLAARGTVYLSAGDLDFVPAVDAVLDRGQRVVLVVPQGASLPPALYQRGDAVVYFDKGTWEVV